MKGMLGAMQQVTIAWRVPQVGAFGPYHNAELPLPAAHDHTSCFRHDQGFCSGVKGIVHFRAVHTGTIA